MSPKNACRHRFVPLLLVASGMSFVFSCKKDAVVSPESTTTPTPTVMSTKVPAAITNDSAVVPTYVVSGVISLTDQSNLTISGKSIAGGTSAPITLCNCHNITITNCKLYNASNVGIYLYNCYNITVNGNFITNVTTGVYVDHSVNGGIAVTNNQFLNMKGPFPRGQFVQFNNVNGANNQIYSNICENIFGQSDPEDGISLYESNGTAASPIKVNSNVIRGGGPSASGGGIMLGDSGGSYETANGNTLVNPGQYGMAISGGAHNSITNNLIYGVSQSFTNIGLYIETIGSVPVTYSTVSGNWVKFYNSAGAINAAWIADGVSTPVGWSNNKWNADVDATVLPATIITDH